MHQEPPQLSFTRKPNPEPTIPEYRRLHRRPGASPWSCKRPGSESLGATVDPLPHPFRDSGREQSGRSRATIFILSKHTSYEGWCCETCSDWLRLSLSCSFLQIVPTNLRPILQQLYISHATKIKPQVTQVAYQAHHKDLVFRLRTSSPPLAPHRSPTARLTLSERCACPKTQPLHPNLDMGSPLRVSSTRRCKPMEVPA